MTPSLTLDEVHHAFASAFPARASSASLEYVTTEPLEDQRFGIVMRLIVWETSPDGVQSIRDVKEQQLVFDQDQTPLDRLRNFTTALARVTSAALEHAEVETRMPHDFMAFGALKLSKPQSVDDFVKALSVRSRLGKYLPASAPPPT